MGGSWQRNAVNPYNFANQYPTVTFGFSSAAPSNVQLTTAQFPGGISSTDLGTANSMASFLGGIVTQTNQTFRVAARRPATFRAFRRTSTTISTTSRFTPRTTGGGSRTSPSAPVSSGSTTARSARRTTSGCCRSSNGSFEQTMFSPSTTITFVNGEFYNKDLNNFGPTAGFAWDLTKDGRTALRGGYSLTFVNEDTMTVARAASTANAGLSTAVTRSNLYATAAGGPPLPTTPTFLTERTLSDQLALSTTAVLWGIDPDIEAPEVHQVSVGIQRELPWSMAVEARYVGTFGREIWRGVDNNQIQMTEAFMADFARARSNGFLAQQAGLAFSPVFNPNVPGSQALTVLPTFGRC